MPEGDSVFRLRVRLEGAAPAGSMVVAGEVRSGSRAGETLAGRRITSWDTHGKNLLTRLDDDAVLHTHLLMQGSWTVTAPGRAVPRREQHKVRVRMLLESGRCLWGMDVPVVDLVAAAEEKHLLAHLGPDPLRADWDAAEALRRLAARPGRTVVAALLDQRNLAGLGNLWVNELAFLRGLHPLDPIGLADLEPLVALAHRCLTTSATVPGMYQVTTGTHRRGETHWVVGRAGRPCLRCGTLVQVRDEVTGDPERRRTWWCPHCQPRRGPTDGADGD